jgi:release factor glutamine methyltransferase
LKTLLEILNLSTDHLKNKIVSEARLSSELLIASVLNIRRLDIYLQFERILTEEEIKAIRGFLKRRAAHEPVQYILGHTEFYGMKFIIDQSVLIPRSDTEILVEKAIGLIGNRDLTVYEIGTGSGCIAVSLAKHCPNIRIKACDISIQALDIAEKNADLNGYAKRITFEKLNILENVPEGKYDILISNPPYISKPVFENLDRQVRDYEPAGALTDGMDGLTFYRRINELAPVMLNDGGSIIIEIGYDQAEKVREIYKKSFRNVEVLKDYSKNDRVVTAYN